MSVTLLCLILFIKLIICQFLFLNIFTVNIKIAYNLIHIWHLFYPSQMHHCFIRDQVQCFILIYVFNSILKYIYYVCHFFHSAPSIVVDCFLLNVLALLHSNSDSFVVFSTSKIRTAFAKPSSCTLPAFYDCWYHLHCIPLYLGPMHHQTCPHAWQGAKKWSQLDTYQHHPSPNKPPMLSHQFLHCISAPANWGIYNGV